MKKEVTNVLESFPHSQLPKDYKQTVVGVIPEAWDHQTFGHLYIEPSRNGIYKTSEYHGRGTRIVNMGEMFGFEFISDQDMSRVTITTSELSTSGLQDGDLLFGRRSIVPAGAGKCSLVVSPSEPITFESSIIRVRLNKTVAHPRFYYYFFASPTGRSLVSTIVAGTNVKGIRATELKELKVPLPTKAEQEAIAEALSDADAHIESLEQLIAKKRHLKQGAMQELLTGKKRLPGYKTSPGFKQTEVGVIPEDWSQATIRDIATKVGSGVTPTGGNKRYKEYGRPFVRSQNVGWGRLLLDELAFIDEETHNSFLATELKRDDVLLNITGASIGRSALSDGRLIGGNVNQHVCIIRSDVNKAIPKFINLLLLSDLGQRQIESFQAGGNRQGLNFAQIESVKLPLPPIKAEQEAIAAILSDMDDEITALEAKLSKARQLKQGMMQELLTGRIRLV